MRDVKRNLADVLFKKRQHAQPGILRGRRVVVWALIIEKRVLGTGVDFDVVRDVIGIERSVELAPRLGGEVAGRIRADDRACARDSRERARVYGVVWRNHLEPVVGAGPADREAAAHTKADRAEPRIIDA